MGIKLLVRIPIGIPLSLRDIVSSRNLEEDALMRSKKCAGPL